MILDYLKIAGCSVSIYLFMIIAIRIFGKKEMSQLSLIDFVFILLISNAVQNAMVLGDNSFQGGIVAASSLFIANFILKMIMMRYKSISNIIQGEPIMLIYKGIVKEGNLSKVEISMDELLAAVHEHGVANLKDVDLAILEVDGNISVISKNFMHRTSNRRKVPQKISNIKF